MVDVIPILEAFPFLVPSLDFKEWNGFILFEDEEIPVTLAVPNFPYLKDISLMCPVNWEAKLQQNLTEFSELLNFRKDKLLQLLLFFKNREVQFSANLRVSKDISTTSQSDYSLYNRVVEELRQVGEDLVMGCSADLSRVMLRKVDTRGVDHQLVVGLSPHYPFTPATVVDADLPDVAVSQLSQARTIVEIMNTFENLVESLQDFWIVYEDLKSNTWVIDPENPRRRDVHCRIVIGENISMLVTLNPQDVNTCPDVKFLGPEKLVTPFINSMENKLKTVGWDEDTGVCDNLLRLLGLSHFPQRDTAVVDEAISGECSICFTVRSHDDDPLPVKVCNNTRCDSYFHISCLAQWFQAVPTNEASFNLISGSCPSCGEKILCPITVS